MEVECDMTEMTVMVTGAHHGYCIPLSVLSCHKMIHMLCRISFLIIFCCPLILVVFIRFLVVCMLHIPNKTVENYQETSLCVVCLLFCPPCLSFFVYFIERGGVCV